MHKGIDQKFVHYHIHSLAMIGTEDVFAHPVEVYFILFADGSYQGKVFPTDAIVYKLLVYSFVHSSSSLFILVGIESCPTGGIGGCFYLEFRVIPIVPFLYDDTSPQA